MRCFLEIEGAWERSSCLLVFMISFVREFSYIFSHILGMSKLIKRFNKKCCNYKGKYYSYDKILELHFYDSSTCDILSVSLILDPANN